MASTASSMVSTVRASSASASMKACRLLRTMSAARAAMRGMSTGRSATAMLLHVADAVADAFGGVAHALEVGVDLDDAEDEAQVDGHGLLHGEQVEGGLVDVALQAVDGDLAAADEVADGEVAHAVGLNGALNGLLGEAGHDQEVLLQIVETLLKANACHPNLPVM